MSKQTVPIIKTCDHCKEPAIIGVYSWNDGDGDVNLDKPDRVVCGEHKPHLNSEQRLRNVKIITKDKQHEAK